MILLGWLLLLSPLLLRLLPAGHGERWHTGVDLGLALAGGGALAALAWYLAPFHLVDQGVTASDFAEYCETALASAGLEGCGWSRNRSRLAALLPGLLARGRGPLDGLLLGALLSTGLIGASLYLWGRALHGRIAGVAAVLLAGTLAPLVVQSRMLSFYAEITAACTLAAATSALAVRFRSAPAFLAAGVGIGLALLVDVRGLLWAAPCLLLAAGALLVEAVRCRRGALALALLVAPVALSYQAGDWAWTPDASTLEGQSDIRGKLVLEGYTEPSLRAEILPRSSFVWGRTPVTAIPTTFLHLYRLRRAVPDAVTREPETLANRRDRIDPWRWVVVGAALLAVAGLWRRPLLLLALGLTGAPYALALQGAINFKDGGARFLASGAPGVAVLFGLAFATLAQGPVPAEPAGPAPDGWRALARPLAAALLAWALVTGALPSRLSPVAAWRRPWQPGVGDMQDHIAAARGGERSPRVRETCARGIRQELARSGPRFFPVDRFP